MSRLAAVLILLDEASSLRLSTAGASRHAPAVASAQKWVLGLNQYSHDAGVALLVKPEGFEHPAFPFGVSCQDQAELRSEG